MAALVVVTTSISVFIGHAKEPNAANVRTVASRQQTTTAPTQAVLPASENDAMSAPMSGGLQALRQCAHEQFEDACLKIPALQERLDSLLSVLGDRREADFDYSLIVGREGFIDGDVVTLSGSQPHAAPYAGVAITVDLRTGIVLVGIHAGDNLAVYGATERTVESLPSRMGAWIQSREENMKPKKLSVDFR
jgi:hypothetical protein